jgi:DNA-binding HxlR family transcriptional regulator
MLKVTVASYEQAKDCPFRDVLDKVGDKWSFLIFTVLEGEPKRFNEMRRLIGDISQRVLTSSLRKLERDGFVMRTVYPNSPPKVEYELTSLGQSIIEPMGVFLEWAIAAHPKIKRARNAYDQTAT